MGRTTEAMALLLLAATPGCNFPSHQFRDEDCFNGIDDNGDGRIDCADPTCSNQVTCIPAPSPDWSGPVMVSHASSADAAPGCPAGSVFTGSFTLHGGLVPTSLVTDKCPVCDCNFDQNTSDVQCQVSLQVYSNTTCTSPADPTQDVTYSVGNCTKITLNSLIGSYNITGADPTPASSACGARPSVDAPPITFTDTEQAQVCPLDTKAAYYDTCGETSQVSESCVPLLPAGSGNQVCIYQPVSSLTSASSIQCPAFYTEAQPYFTVVDNRKCLQCTCQLSGGCQTVSNGTSIGDYGTSENCAGNAKNYVTRSPGCPLPLVTNPGVPFYVQLQGTTLDRSKLTCIGSERQMVGSVDYQQYAFCCKSP